MTRDHKVLFWCAALAALVPIAARAWIRARLTGRVEPALSRASGQPVRIGDVEMGLLGTLRVDDLRVGDQLRADAMEASVGPTALARGRFAADEIRVERPILSARLENGELNVTRTLRRLGEARRAAARGGPPDPRRPRLRRVRVTGGELVVSLGENGEIRARGLELHPQADGVRVVSAGLSVRLRSADRLDMELEGAFERAGFDLRLLDPTVTRAALDRGRLRARVQKGVPLELTQVAVLIDRRGARLDGRLAGGGPLGLRVHRDGSTLLAEVEAGGLPLVPLSALVPWLRDGVASGRVTARWDRREGELAARGRLSLARARFQHDLFARAPLALDGTLAVEATYRPRARTARARGRIETGGLAADADIDLAWDASGTPTHGHVAVEVPRVPCAGALLALPDAVRAPLAGLELDGDLAGRAAASFDLARPEETRLDIALDVDCRALAEAAHADPRALAGPFRHRFPDGTERTMAEGDDGFVPLDRLPSHVAAAFIAGEDARFFSHRGFDPVELARSFAADVAARRIVRGGSTITQQLAKNLWLGRDRTLARKLAEAVLAWRLEDVLPKERILEIYLNLVELGEGAFGVGPAARLWFDKPAWALSPAEAAFLAALTPAPVSTHRRLARAGDLDDDMRERVATILRHMKRSGAIDEATYRAARRERLDLRLGRAPR